MFANQLAAWKTSRIALPWILGSALTRYIFIKKVSKILANFFVLKKFLVK